MAEPNSAHWELSRRGFLGLAGVAGLAAAAGGAVTAAPARAAVPMLLQDKVFIQRGSELGAWIFADDVPSVPDWSDIGYTTPTFIQGDYYDATLMGGLPAGNPWSVAQAPRPGGWVNRSPQPGETFLNATEAAHVDTLATVCMGDEISWSSTFETQVSQWNALLKQEAPNALMHSNQAPGQWSDPQVQSFLAHCKPDLLTFDDYYFCQAAHWPAGSVTRLYNNAWRYRRLARSGWDGQGNYETAWGQYLLGIGTSLTSSGSPGPCLPSATEQFVVPFVSRALGAKWLTMFIWVKNHQDENKSLLFDAAGNRTSHFTRFQRISRMNRNLSPYLVRLRSENAAIVRGKYDNGVPTPTPKSSIDDYAPGFAPRTCLANVTVTTPSAGNGHLPTDILIGAFSPTIQLTAADRGSYIPAADTPFFMVVNAVGFANQDVTVRDSGGGGTTDHTQTIRLDFDLAGSGRTSSSLRRIDPDTGAVSTPTLAPTGGSTYSLSITLDGGLGTLFYWV